MKYFKVVLLGLIGAILGAPFKTARYVGRARTGDVSFQYRMGAGFPGDVSRIERSAIEPCRISVSQPPLLYGTPVLLDDGADVNSVRQIAAGDGSATPLVFWGITVRPYPQQVDAATNFGESNFGAAIPPARGVIDILRSGYIMSKVNGAVVKGGQVYVWAAAASGAHIPGQLESAASGTDTVAVVNAFFNGPADGNGVCEVEFNV